MKKHLALKIIVALLPALLFTQNWSWMTGNKIMGIAFIVFWVFFVWYVLKMENKNGVLQKLIRALEIGFFLLPISALILTFVVGAQVTKLIDNEFAQAGAVVGTAIGGMFVVGIGFVVGLFGGIICHLIANKYEKKAGSEEDIKSNFFEKHKVITMVLVIIVLAIIASATSQDKDKLSTAISLKDIQNTSNTATEAVADKNVPDDTNQPEKACPDIIKSPASFSFKWSKTIEGNDGLFLAPDFIKLMEFGNEYKLDNLPDVSEYSSDDFYCTKGSNAGESVNKLYCRSTFMYTPLLKKKNIDKDGNIVSNEEKYIKTFVFDLTSKDYKVINDLNSLKLESIICSNDYF